MIVVCPNRLICEERKKNNNLTYHCNPHEKESGCEDEFTFRTDHNNLKVICPPCVEYLCDNNNYERIR